ncbi:MAG TPA: PAS domain-containing sensor histidine kinase [Chryseosolibacter sp.]|nr:PAS domain-containing sensor histidine kinase [Chryseosolibacter sp.]
MNEQPFKYELFFDMSPDLLCIAGYDGYFKKINRAVATTLGYSFEELYARPINDFVHPDHKEVTEKVRNELRRSKPLYSFENRYLTKGGETVWLSWTSMPVESEGVIFAIAKNITDKKRVEADRNAMLANLTQRNKELIKLNFAGSDDLASSIHSLLALLELVDLSRVDDTETRHLLELLQYAGGKVGNSLDKHTNDLTAKTRNETAREETNFQRCLDEVLQSMATIIHTSKSTILADFSRLPIVRFNNSYLKSIFLNLITNAIKYARPDELPVISIRSENNAGQKQLIISDNGAGFDAGKATGEIFRLPQRFQNSPSSTGIGLYLVYSHVSALGGEVAIDSKIGEGTTVVITFKD